MEKNKKNVKLKNIFPGGKTTYLAIVAIVSVLAAMIVNCFSREPVTELIRPDSNTTEYQLEFLYRGEKETICVSVGEKTLTSVELETLYDKAILELERVLPGENEDLLNVTYPLVMVNEIEDCHMKIDWYIEDLSVVDYWGDIVGKVGEQTAIYATITYLGNIAPECEKQREIPFAVTVGKNTDYKENIYLCVKDAIANEDENYRYDTKFVLPESIGGESLIFYEDGENMTLYFIIIIPVVGLLIFLTSKEKKKEEHNKKVEAMLIDYPELVMKLSMYIDAGMTTYNALMQIDGEYSQSGDSRLGKNRPGFMEVHRICNAMKLGMPEINAYSEFGKEAAVFEYIKLGTLLSQNLLHGNENLKKELKLEMTESFNNRKNRAIVKGELAGTKLLAPMVMMLVIVLVVIMVPAFMSY